MSKWLRECVRKSDSVSLTQTEALEIRFDPAVASQFAGRIAAIDDLQRLKRLHRVAVEVDDLAAFQHMLDSEA